MDQITITFSTGDAFSELLKKAQEKVASLKSQPNHNNHVVKDRIVEIESMMEAFSFLEKGICSSFTVPKMTVDYIGR